MASSSQEYDMWIKGLSVLLGRKHNPEMAFIKNAWKRQKRPEVNLREVIALLGKLNYQASLHSSSLIYLGFQETGEDDLSESRCRCQAQIKL